MIECVVDLARVWAGRSVDAAYAAPRNGMPNSSSCRVDHSLSNERAESLPSLVYERDVLSDSEANLVDSELERTMRITFQQASASISSKQQYKVNARVL